MKRILAVILAFTLVLPLTGCDAVMETAEKLGVEDMVQTVVDYLPNNVVNFDTSEITAQIEADSDALRRAIRNSPTEIVQAEEFIPGETYTGKAYYVSNNGSDKNDGRSPEKPFATLSKLENKLKFGDVVFLERGSVWRGERLPGNHAELAGVTFSAYGTGEKPRLYGSPENGTGEEKWQLAYSDDTGKKIWTYYTEMTDVGAIVLDEEIIVPRDVAYWEKGAYQHIYMYDQNTETLTLDDVPYNVEQHLPDMNCFPMLEYPENPNPDCFYLLEPDKNGEPQFVMGTLYFRCDAGNPGKLYKDIEFISPYDSFITYINVPMVFDNLTIMYSADGLSSLIPLEETEQSCIIQNCEISYIGGVVQRYESEGSGEEITRHIARGGDCVSIGGCNTLIRNNYLHHGYDHGIFILNNVTPSVENVTVSGNLVEKCVWPMMIYNEPMHDISQRMDKNFIIENNYVMHAGVDRWNKTKVNEYWGPVLWLNMGAFPHDGTFYIRNNVFAYCVSALMDINLYSEEYSRVFSGNTYVYTFPYHILRMKTNDAFDTVFDSLSQKKLAELLGDETGQMYQVPLR